MPDPDWETILESRAEMDRDARSCPECHGAGAVEVPGCNCDAPDDGTGYRHRPHCGLEPCPRGCPFVPPSMTEAPY